MESNAMPGGMYSSVNPGILGLEMSLNHKIPPQTPNQMQQQQQHQHNPMATFGHRDGEYHQQTQQSVKPWRPCAVRAKNQSLTLSDDDEPGPENISDDGNIKVSPWQRVKWNDNMVRLLIMIVFYIGDEVGSEGNDPANKKKGGGVLQKKGKWKSVSRAMMEKGFYVSPQQCEDKFNDLNKRYKRVNDILGKGTACRVVENQTLLDSMDHLSPKMKEEVKKLLNSKHLFFREMCAYHNSSGHGSGASASGSGAGGNQHSPAEVGAEPSHAQFQLQQQRCLHSSVNASIVPNSNRGENEGSKLAKEASGEDYDEDYDDEDDDDGGGDGDSYEDNDEVVDRGSRRHDHGHEDDNDTDGGSSRKRQRKRVLKSPLIQQLNMELLNVLQDETKNPFEKRRWIDARLMHLEDQRVGIQCQAFELEKQRLKWLKFSTKKEREMEREKLANERLRLENERMVLLIRHKELELLGHHHHCQ